MLCGHIMYYSDEKGQFSFTEKPIVLDKSTKEWADFMDFHKSHPEVYEAFEKEVFRIVQQGRDKYSLYVIREEIRWKFRKKLKFSNSFTPYYARLFVENNPSLKSMFTLKNLKIK